MDKPRKGIALAIIERMKRPDDKSKMDDEQEMNGMEMAAEEIITAVKDGNSKLLAQALKSAVQMCKDDEYNDD